MKYLKKIYILAFAIMSLTSCEEIIVLDLKNTESKIVIDAVVDATAQYALVILTQSNGFYDTLALDFATDVSVNLTLADGSVVDFTMIEEGVFLAFPINVTEGDELTITVIDGNGNEYSATEKVPHNIVIDSLEVDEVSIILPFDTTEITTYTIKTYWQDVANKESFYRLRTTVNNTRLPGLISVFNDVNIDGEVFTELVPQVFEKGDTVTIELFSIDAGSYRYYNDLDRMKGGLIFNSTTPSNPKTNFTNNPLGYFGIMWRDEKTVILN